MRILTVGNMYPPHHLGGYELVWQAAVRALRADGNTVRVLTTDHREAGAGSREDPDVHRELRWYWRDHDFPRRGPAGRLSIELHNRRVFDRHVAELRPDLISWWAMGGLSLSLLHRTNIPAIGWVNDDWLVYAPLVDGWGRLTRRRPRLEGAARWVFCSDALRRSMLRALPGLRDTVAEPQGVGPEFTEHPDTEWSGRLLYVGRLDERKGVDTLIEALAGLERATLRVVGGGDPAEADRLRRLAAGLGVADRVRFEGPVSRGALPEIYAAEDATVFPVKWFEPYGLVPLESMAVGRPVVATGRGGSGDYLRDGQNALLFAPGDAGALAQAVTRLEEPELRATLRAGGLRTARELTEQRWLEAVLREHRARYRGRWGDG